MKEITFIRILDYIFLVVFASIIALEYDIINWQFWSLLTVIGLIRFSRTKLGELSPKN